MKFVIIGYDGPDGEAKRKVHRAVHLLNLEQLDKQRRVILAGPLADKTGSLLVLEFDSREEAEEFVRQDPYAIHGVFKSFEIHPFTQVFPIPHE